MENTELPINQLREVHFREEVANGISHGLALITGARSAADTAVVGGARGPQFTIGARRFLARRS